MEPMAGLSAFSAPQVNRGFSHNRFSLRPIVIFQESKLKMTQHLQSNVSQDLIWEICRTISYAITVYESEY